MPPRGPSSSCILRGCQAGTSCFNPGNYLETRSPGAEKCLAVELMTRAFDASKQSHGGRHCALACVDISRNLAQHLHRVGAQQNGHSWHLNFTANYSTEFSFLFAAESEKLWLPMTTCTYTSKAFASSIVFLWSWSSMVDLLITVRVPAWPWGGSLPFPADQYQQKGWRQVNGWVSTPRKKGMASSILLNLINLNIPSLSVLWQGPQIGQNIIRIDH